MRTVLASLASSAASVIAVLALSLGWAPSAIGVEDPATAIKNAELAVKTKTGGLEAKERAVVAAEKKLASLTKDQERLLARMQPVEEAAAKMAAARDAVAKATEQVRLTSRTYTRADGTLDVLVDPVELKKQEDAEKAFNQVKRQNRRAEDQLALLKAEQATLEKQVSSQTTKLANLVTERDDAAAELAAAQAEHAKAMEASGWPPGAAPGAAKP